MKKRFNKKAQQTMGLPFSLIFAIFLIIVFLIVAFIAIKNFLNIGSTTDVGLFYKEFQEEVTKAWQGQSSETNFEIDLPSGIEKVCFANLSAKITGSPLDYQHIRNYNVYEANTFLIPPEKAQKMEWKQIDHLNITKITEKSNPYCVEVSNGLKIHKGFYDKLVWVE